MVAVRRLGFVILVFEPPTNLLNDYLFIAVQNLVGIVCVILKIYEFQLIYLQKFQRRWRGGVTGKAFGLAISRSRVQILLEATLRNNLRQVVYTYVPLSTSSITWYRPKGGDALRLGR